MLPSAVTDIKAFVPARDLEVSKAFYSDLGFIINFTVGLSPAPVPFWESFIPTFVGLR